MGQPATIQPPVSRMSIQEYLRFDDETPGKHEYDRGTVIAMAGGTGNHGAAAFNLSVAIGRRISETACQGFTSDVRLGAPGIASYNYPDLIIVCGPVRYDPRDPSNNTVINPTLIVEVLSPSTEGIDRGRKFDSYLQLESLQEYVLVSQDQPRVQSFYRQPDGSWGAFIFAVGLQASLKLHSLKFEIPLGEIYTNIVFPPSEPVV